jgi:hypothetical protein
MRRRALIGSSVFLVIAASCGSAPTSAPTPSATFDMTKYRSTDPLAEALDRSVLTSADLAKISVRATEVPAGAGPRPRPSGPLNVDGIAATLVRGDVLRPVLSKAKVGAYHQYSVGAGTVLGIRAIAFDRVRAAQAFSDALIAATPGIKAKAHPALHVGVLQVRTLQNPVAAQPGGPARENAASYAVYASGVEYFVSFVGPPDAVRDDRVLAVLKAQDEKYQRSKNELGA